MGITLGGGFGGGGPTTPGTYRLTVNEVEGGKVVIYEENGGGDQNPSGDYNAGDNVFLQAKANAGYKLVEWSGATALPGGGGTAMVTMNSNLTVTAVFERLKYTLTVNLTHGGSVDGFDADNTSRECNYGEEITLTAHPHLGFGFGGWTGTRDSDEPTYTFTITDNTTLIANFRDESKTYYMLTVSASPSIGGIVSLQSQSYIEGTTVTVAAAANRGYEFVRWEWNGGSSLDPTITVEMNQNRTRTAIFREITRTLTVNVMPNSSSGSVVRVPRQDSYKDGDTVALTAQPSSNFQFSSWSGDGVTSTGSNTARVIMNGNKTITATFVAQQVNPPPATTYTLTMARNPTDGGSTTPAANRTGIEPGTSVPISASPTANYEFVNWTVTNGQATIVDENNVGTQVTVNSDATVTANFRVKGGETYMLTIQRDSANGGTVSVDNTNSVLSVIGVYANQTVTVTAKPNSGYQFMYWTNASTSKEPSIQVTMNGPKTLTAHFRRGSTVTDNRNGRTYRTVSIGGKTWMAENLDYPTTTSAGGKDTSWCYGNDPSNCEKYGRLYNWYAANDKNVCNMGGTSGWRLPSNADWNNLSEATGGLNAGERLAAITPWTAGLPGGSSSNYTQEGKDIYGFSALPAGYRYYITWDIDQGNNPYMNYLRNGDFVELFAETKWHSSDDRSGEWTGSNIYSWNTRIFVSNGTQWEDGGYYVPGGGFFMYRSVDGTWSSDSWDKKLGMSVRCVKD